jgi:hypothetical protein
VRIRDSRLISGAYTSAAFVADSGDSADITIEDSLLVGVVWTRKPRTVFSRCRVFGTFGALCGGNPDPWDNTRFINSFYSDSPKFEDTVTTMSLGIDLQAAGPGVVFENCKIALEYTRLNLRGSIFRQVDIDFRTGTDRFPDKDWVMVVEGSQWDRVTIQENIPTAKEPAVAYLIGGVTAASLRDCFLISDNQKIRWANWSAPGGGYVGEWDNHEESVRNIALFRNLGEFSDYYGKTRLFAGNAAPATGAFLVGDIVFNQAAAAAGSIGWVCVTAGSPGSWKAFGAIAS